MRPSCSNNHVFGDRSFLSCRSGNQGTVAATCSCDRSLLVYRSQAKVNHHVAATHRSDKSLCLYRRIFVKIFVPATEFCWCNMTQKIKSDTICATCHGNKTMWQRQRSSQTFFSTHKRFFAATSCQTCTQKKTVLLLQSVAATCPLVCGVSGG